MIGYSTLRKSCNSCGRIISTRICKQSNDAYLSQYSNRISIKKVTNVCGRNNRIISQSTTTPEHNVFKSSNQIRWFGRKAGRMGHHLQNLDEMAHRGEHQKAMEKRQKKKGKTGGKGGGGEGDVLNDSSRTMDIPDLTLTEYESETKFPEGQEENENEVPTLPSEEEVKKRMMRVVDAMEKSFQSIRGAEPTPELFDSVQVKAYGTMTPLNSVAQVVISSPTLATISCFDPEIKTAARDAVRDMVNMNFNPRIEDGDILVPLPRVSAETRKALVKQLGKVAESTRQRVRRIRRAAQDVVKKGKDGKLGPGISEDDAFRAAKQIDEATDQCIKQLNDVLEKKQNSVMSV